MFGLHLVLLTLYTTFGVVETRRLCQAQSRSYVNTACSICHLMHPQSTSPFQSSPPTNAQEVGAIGNSVLFFGTLKIGIQFPYRLISSIETLASIAHHNVCDITHICHHQYPQNILSLCNIISIAIYPCKISQLDNNVHIGHSRIIMYGPTKLRMYEGIKSNYEC